MATPEATFLHQRNKQLHTSGPVEFAADRARTAGERIPNEPSAKLNAYLGNIATHSLVSTIAENDPVGADKLLRKRQAQINARVIKPQDIPESFWETQRRAAREQGHGDIEITDDLRKEAINVIQTDQRESFADWVEYLNDDDTYPTWFKYYALDGISKLAPYDKDKGEFSKRSKRTTGPFPALNREALSYVYDEINHYHITKESSAHHNNPDEDPEYQQVLNAANFGKLYAHSLAEVGFTSDELLKETRGSWVKYDQSNNPKNVKRLSESLKGYGTGWCTAGEGFAKTQLASGEFYVYYTKDEKGVDRVPRIAVRMQNGQVAEVRGIIGGGNNVGPAENTKQELEPIMIDTAMAKVRELPGGEAWEKKSQDMKQLTRLEHKIKADQELTASELRFLYEFDDKIKGFGYGEDPRIEELKGERDWLADMMIIFDTTDENELVRRLLLDVDNNSYVIAENLHKFTSLDATTANSLMDLNKGYYVAENLDKFTGLDHVDLANRLLEAGQSYAVANNLDKFTGLDHFDLANRLLEAGQSSALARNLDKFTGLNATIAERLLDVGQRHDVADNLHKFTSLNATIANHLIEAYRGDTVADNIDKFPGIDRAELANRLIETDQGATVADNIDKFPSIDRAELANHLIGTDKGHAIADNLDKFPSIDRAELANRLIETEQGNDIANNLDKFPDLDHNDLASRLTETDNNYSIFNNFDKFTGLDYNNFANNLIETNRAASVVNHFDKFTDLDVTVAQGLLEAGFSYSVAKNLNKFTGLDTAIAERLKAEGHRSDVEGNSGSFNLTEQQLQQLLKNR